MSANGDGEDDSGPGRREVAHRLFAAEFDDSTVSYAESDEERAPKYVVTPTGARVNRLFAVGVLTEVESVNEDVLRARVVDPTGAFVSYAGQYQPDAAAFFERTDPPAFVALTGKARTFEPDDGDRIYTSVRPESVSVVDGETRDRWTISAAEATLRRVAAMAEAKSLDATGEALGSALEDRGYDASLAAGVPIALDRYGTTTAYLSAVRRIALDALSVVTGDREAVRAIDIAPDEAGTESLGAIPDAVTGDGASGDTAEGDSTADEDTTVDTATPDTGSVDGAPAEDAESLDGATTADSGSVDDAGQGSKSPDSTDDGSVAADTESTDEDDIGDFDDGLGDFDGDLGDAGDAGDTGEDDIGDFDDDGDLYELDEEERREVEEEFDVGFESGTEVGDPGEAGIEVPGPEELDDEVEGAADDEVDAETETTAGGDAGATAATTEDEDAGATDVNLETAAIEVMENLDDGDGADREAVVAAVVDEHGADPGAVADAIEDALMSGRCYEPTEDRLKAI